MNSGTFFLSYISVILMRLLSCNELLLLLVGAGVIFVFCGLQSDEKRAVTGSSKIFIHFSLSLFCSKEGCYGIHKQ